MAIEVEAPLAAFVDDDDGYRRWLAANPDGYVLNTTRSPNRAYLMLHRARCRHISGSPERRWTTQYAKVCCPSATALASWASTTVGAEPERCAFCLA